MRELKFRAWSEELSKLSKPFSFGQVLNFTDENGLGTIKSLDREIVMQYTGLKDKNGKEIYEGDIVRWDNNGHPSDSVIRWYENGFWLTSTKHHRYLPNIMQVIGNEYENPELLA